MASAAGWYVGAVCKDPDCGGMIVPFDRYTDYYATQEDVVKYCGVFLEEEGGNEECEIYRLYPSEQVGFER